MGSQRITVNKFYYEKRSPGKHEVGYQHDHSLFEIYFLEKGFCHYFIDNDTYDVQAGDIVLIPEGVIHKTIYGSIETKRHLIYCAPIYVPTAVIPYLPSMLYIYRNKKVTARVQEIFDNIEKEYLSGDEFSEEVLLHHIHLLFFLLARNTDTEAPHRTGSIYTTQTVAYIKEHYAEDLRLSELATRCSVSPEHLSRVFKLDTGFGISEYLSIVRLQQAQRLLRSSRSLSVSQIAQACGFHDSNYFSKRFKQRYGVSPRRFRKC